MMQENCGANVHRALLICVLGQNEAELEAVTLICENAGRASRNKAVFIALSLYRKRHNESRTLPQGKMATARESLRTGDAGVEKYHRAAHHRWTLSRRRDRHLCRFASPASRQCAFRDRPRRLRNAAGGFARHGMAREPVQRALGRD